ncbi:U6 snRNA phosphodiesterase, putative [Plasmodium sp. DRC-Itaito]|nr:U6 snRNA phosphodiesterase, putative [Plasmodium sp. DRC-Itaito]
MSNQGDFNTYIYIPVKCNERVKKRCELCFDILFKLIEMQLKECYTKSKEKNLLYNNDINKGEIHKHIYYQLDKLNEHIKENNIEKDFKEPLHITISGSLNLKRYMIASFINKIKEELKNQNSFYLFFRNKVDLYKSQKNTKYFCSYTVKEDQQELYLNALIEKINKILNEFDLKDTHLNRIYHLSLAYTNINLDVLLEKKKKCVEEETLFWPNINELILNKDIKENSSDDLYIYVNCIHIRIGYKLYKIPFKSFDDNLNISDSYDSYMSSTDE